MPVRATTKLTFALFARCLLNKRLLFACAPSCSCLQHAFSRSRACHAVGPHTARTHTSTHCTPHAHAPHTAHATHAHCTPHLRTALHTHTAHTPHTHHCTHTAHTHTGLGSHLLHTATLPCLPYHALPTTAMPLPQPTTPTRLPAACHPPATTAHAACLPTFCHASGPPTCTLPTRATTYRHLLSLLALVGVWFPYLGGQTGGVNRVGVGRC